MNSWPTDPNFLTNEMKLIHHKQVDALNIFPDLPSTWQHIPDLWSANNDVSLQSTKNKAHILIPNSMKNTTNNFVYKDIQDLIK